jgi:hypothetical protein
MPGATSENSVMAKFSIAPPQTAQDRRRGNAQIVGDHALVYADTTAQGRGLRASGRGRAKGRSPVTAKGLRPMIDADAPSTGCYVA